jgi:hypothetical protein
MGNFKVADTVFAEAKAKDYTRDQWEAALDNLVRFERNIIGVRYSP